MKRKKPKPFSCDSVRDESLLFLSFDTETEGLGGKLLMITACDLNKTHVFAGDSMLDDFMALVASMPYPAIWYAHHAQYDWRYILPWIIEHAINCQISMRTETDIYQIALELDGNKIVMRDSLALFPAKLSELAQTFCPELPKGEIDIAHFDPCNPEHVEYAKRDAEILRRAMPRVDMLLRHHFGIGAGHTSAGTALNAWQATIPQGTYYDPTEYGPREDFIRSAYYGGLVFLTRNDLTENHGEIAAETYDINSCYPHVMETFGVPYGRAIQTDDYETGEMGIYRARVKAPDNLVIPILPSRNERGHMQWVRGSFETVVTSAELIFAAQHGYIIEDILEGVAFEQTVFPFNAFIARCKELRKTYKGQPQEKLAKLMQNSLFGKFGSRRERMRIFHPEKDGDIIGASPVDAQDYFWMRKEFEDNLRALPQWAVFITAHARLKLLQQIYTLGADRVIYGDTDSITCLAGHRASFDVGDDYGQFKLERQWLSFRAIAPKVYVGTLPDGTYRGAAKGMRKASMEREHWRALHEGRRIRLAYPSLPSLRVAMKDGIKPARIAERSSTLLDNSAHWQLTADGIRPKLAACKATLFNSD